MRGRSIVGSSKIGSSHNLDKRLRFRREDARRGSEVSEICFPVIYSTLYSTDNPISPTLGLGICYGIHDGLAAACPRMSPLGDISTMDAFDQGSTRYRKPWPPHTAVDALFVSAQSSISCRNANH